jgi:hypothetical protein
VIFPVLIPAGNSSVAGPANMREIGKCSIETIHSCLLNHSVSGRPKNIHQKIFDNPQ